MKDTANIKGVVLKVASRCNLNCEYCYMYNLGDETFRIQPKFMSDEVVDNLLLRVQNYISTNSITDFQFIFHGGEPLLIAPTFYQDFVKKANERFSDKTTLDFLIQTNGVLLSPEWCRVLGNLEIKIGISIDGMTESANRYRVTHRGKSSLEATLKGIKNAQQSQYLRYLPGILSVINIQQNPTNLYQQYIENNIYNINVLLPDGTHDNLPNGYNSNETIYGDWLIELFDNWFYDKKKDKPQIGIFNQLINLILGSESSFESWGGGNDIYVIIETNGDIEPQDSMKSCGDGFTKTHLNVRKNELADIFKHPIFDLCITGQQQLSIKCQNCEVRDVCNGGFITHRFSQLNGFDNPSIYCKDLEKLIRYISKRIEEVLERNCFTINQLAI